MGEVISTRMVSIETENNELKHEGASKNVKVYTNGKKWYGDQNALNP